MLELSHMNMNNFGSPETSKQVVNEEKKSGLKGLINKAANTLVFVSALAGAGALSQNAEAGTNKLHETNISQTEKVNVTLETADDCINYLKGHENNPVYAIVAISELVKEMDNAGLKEIGTIGIYDHKFTESSVSNKVDVLRDFVTKHLNSEVGKHYHIRKELFDKNGYTTFDLEKIAERAKDINDKKHN